MLDIQREEWTFYNVLALWELCKPNGTHLQGIALHADFCIDTLMIHDITEGYPGELYVRAGLMRICTVKELPQSTYAVRYKYWSCSLLNTFDGDIHVL